VSTRALKKESDKEKHVPFSEKKKKESGQGKVGSKRTEKESEKIEKTAVAQNREREKRIAKKKKPPD